MQKTISLFFLLISFTIFSQNEFTLPADINPKFNFIKTYDSLVKLVPKNITSAEWKTFCIDITYNIQINYDKNYFYTNWDEASAYLTKVMKQVCRFDISDKFNDVEVYILKDEDINASALPNGKIFINSGLLANFENEAALAEVLGHEYAHYRFNHALENLTDYYKTHKQYKADKKLIHYADFFARRRLNETEADNLGFMLSGKAGYDIKNGIVNIQVFDTEEKLYKSSYSFSSLKHEIYVDPQKDWVLKPDSMDYYFSTHPTNSERKKALLALAPIFKSNTKKYIIDSVLFHKIQDKARNEVLLTTFTRADYQECLRNAFRFYLLDTTNNNYLYYLTESIRRFMYINPALKDKGFIMHDSKDPAFKEGKYGVLRNISVFINDTVQYQKVKSNPLVKNLYRPFDSYNQAYKYFLKKCKQRNLDEIYLSEALYYLWLNNKAKCDSALTSYLKKENCANRRFAQKLLTNELFKESSGSHLFLIDNTEYYNSVEGMAEYNYYLAWQDFKNNEEIKKEISQALENTKPIVLSDYVRESNKNTYDQYIYIVNQVKSLKTDEEHEQMIRPNQGVAYWENMAKVEPENEEILLRQKKLFILCPELYTILKKEQVKDICLIDFYNYKAVISFNIYNARYLNPFINEMQIVEKEPELFKLKESYPKMLGKIIKKFYKSH